MAEQSTKVKRYIKLGVVTQKELDSKHQRIEGINTAFSNKSKVRKILLSGGSRCFLGHQLVITKRGIIPINEIVVNDLVLALNKDNIQEWKTVTNTFKFNTDKPLVTGNINGYELGCTYDHKFLNKEGKYEEISRILERYTPHQQHINNNIKWTIEDCLDSCLYEIWNTEYPDEDTFVYDITVEDDSNYYIWLGMPVNVHNSGKTFRIVKKIISRALIYKESRHLITRKTLNSVRIAIGQDTLPKVVKIYFPELHKTFHKDFNKNDNIYTLPNGSQIYLRGIGNQDEVEKLLGLEFMTLFVDEASEVNYFAIIKLRTRLAQKCFNNHNIEGKLLEIQALNPTTKSHYTYKEYYDNVNPLDPEVMLDKTIHFHERLNPIDNIENIADDYIDSLLQMSKTDQQRFLYGNYGTIARGSIFGPELTKLRDNKKIVKVNVDPKYESFAVFDIGHWDATSILVYQYYGNKWRVYDHIEKSMESWPYYSKWLKTNHPNVKRIIFPHDGNNTEWGVGTTRRAQAENDGFQVWIAPRYKQNEQIDLTRTHVADCIIDSTCVRLIECLENSTYDYNDKLSLYKSSELKHDEFSHTTSSFIYMITGTLNMFESHYNETAEEKALRIEKQINRAVIKSIKTEDEKSVSGLFMKEDDLARVRR